MNSGKYISEIDSLRAIAVMGVLLFHLFPDSITGGFIGVDIFFVISGFVISRSYLFPLISRQNTFKEFWIKRIRRLFPVYLLIILITTIVAYFLLEPHLLKNYAKSLIGQTFYIQNILFWIEGSYFDKAITKPLLHTWSLGVEEQFYIFFAILIIFSKRQNKRFVVFLSITAIISLYLGYEVLSVSPKTSFYLLPMRIWEFYLGILAFLLTDKFKIKKYNIFWKLLVFILLIIIVLTFFFDKEAPFPGWQSIIACGSTFLIISIIMRLQINNFFLSNRFVQYVGKLSYSLYLWHWVIISLFVTGLNKELNPPAAIVILILSFLLSYLSYTYVENPVRLKHYLKSTRKLFSTVMILSVLLVFAGVFLVQTYGAVFRYEEPYRTWLKTAQQKSPYRCGIIYRITNFKSEICKINDVPDGNKKGVLIIGDSHADQMDEMIADIGTEYDVPVYLTLRNCKLNQYEKRADCNSSIFNKIQTEIQKNNIGNIIAISYWGEHDLKLEDIKSIVSKLLNEKIKIFISETVPYGKYFDPVYQVKNARENKEIIGYPTQDYNQMIQPQRKILEALKT
ncbi:MAG: acyltransferase, partial [Xanthomonadales bacterium]|nr:acyltransferase [Xanthomonadales bacterium]